MPIKSIKHSTQKSEPVWWLTALTDFQTTPTGLSTDAANERRAKFGPNVLQDHKRQLLILQFLARFKNPLVLLLLGASTISAFTGEITNFAIIFTLVIFSVTLDFVQEHRAGKAADSLRKSVSVRASVLRDGQSVEIPVSEVVPGDLAILLCRRYDTG